MGKPVIEFIKDRTADIVLAAAFAAFAGALTLKLTFRDAVWAKGLLVFTEAALVGGIADWFAVTALFKKPLGFISFHTALIPRNRDKLIAGAAALVQEKFLSQDNLREKVNNAKLVDKLVEWLDSPQGRREAGSLVFPLLRRWLDELPGDTPAKWAGWLEAGVKKLLVAQIDLTPWVKQAADWVLANGKDAEAVDGLLAAAREKLADQSRVRGVIRALVEAAVKQKTDSGALGWFGGGIKRFFGETTGAIDYGEATDLVYQALDEFVDEVAEDRSHPLRAWIRGRIETIADKVTTDRTWRQAIERWKAEAIEGADLKEPLEQLIALALGELRAAVRDLAAAGRTGRPAHNPVAVWAAGIAGGYWAAFKENEQMKSWLEENLRKILYHIIDHRHDLIGKIVRDALDILSDKELNARVKRLVNKDLQWIRVNGSLVGGAAGLVIFAVLQLVAWLR